MLVAPNRPGKVLDFDVIHGVPPEHNDVVLVWEFPGARTCLKVVDDAMIRGKVLGKILDRCRLALGLRLPDAVNLGHVALGRHLFVCWFCVGEEINIETCLKMSRCACLRRRPACCHG